MNRWSCAWRIFKDHPVLGCGPGTFQFTYVPYQRPEESTYLSLTGPVDAEMISSAWKYKDLMYVRSNPQMFYLSLGTAHSEYLLALSEGGLLAGLMLFAILALVVWIGLRRTADASNWWAEPRTWAAVSLVAYFVHGAFNNYLDDCKVAMPFWLTLATLAVPLERITARPGR
jgi:O-antigen ligase